MRDDPLRDAPAQIQSRQKIADDGKPAAPRRGRECRLRCDEQGQEDEAANAEEEGKAEPRREIDGAGARVEESGLDQLAPEHPVLTRVAGDVLVDEGDEPLQRSQPLGLSGRAGRFRNVRPGGGAAAQILAVASEAEHDIGGKHPRRGRAPQA